LQVDQEVIQLSALKAIFDLLLTFGVEAFAVALPQDGPVTVEAAERNEEPTPQEPTKSIVPILER
jgi:hypothetical protein